MLLRDLSHHGLLRATGEDRVRFMNGLLTNDVAKLAVGSGLHAAMLTVKGKLLGDLLLFKDDEALLLDVVPESKDKVREAFERHMIVDDVALEDVPGALSLLGDDAAAALGGATGATLPVEPYQHVVAGALRIARVRDLGLDGYRVYGEQADVAALATQLRAAGARGLDEVEAELLRVEAGQPRYGADMGEEQLPMEALLDDTVCHNKGCFMGQEPIARLTARGHINKRLSGLRVEGDGAVEIGARIAGPGRDDAGRITSSVVSPRFGVIALGYVHRSLWEPGTQLTVHESGTATPRPATVAALPFGAESTGAA